MRPLTTVTVATRTAHSGLPLLLRLRRLAVRTLMNIHRQRVPAAAQSIGWRCGQ